MSHLHGIVTSPGFPRDFITKINSFSDDMFAFKFIECLSSTNVQPFNRIRLILRKKKNPN